MAAHGSLHGTRGKKPFKREFFYIAFAEIAIAEVNRIAGTESETGVRDRESEFGTTASHFAGAFRASSLDAVFHTSRGSPGAEGRQTSASRICD